MGRQRGPDASVDVTANAGWVFNIFGR